MLQHILSFELLSSLNCSWFVCFTVSDGSLTIKEIVDRTTNLLFRAPVEA